MACRCICSRASDTVWMVMAVVVVLAVAAIVVPRTLCFGLDIEDDANDNVSNNAKQPKETANLRVDQFSRVWAVNQDMQEGVANLINKDKHTTSDGMEYQSDLKADAAVSDSTLSESAKDTVVDYYNEANKKVQEAYDMVVKNGFSAEAKAKYEAIKEKASDAAGEVGAMMRQ